MYGLAQKYRFWLRLISILVICLFLFNEVSFAGGELSRSGNEKLSPLSRFDPMADIVKNENGLTVEETPKKGNFDVFRDFEDEAVFMYLSRKIGSLLMQFGARYSGDTFADLLQRELGGKDISRFDLNGAFMENGSFCIPYRKVTAGPPYIFRYYLPDNDVFAGSVGEVSIDIGRGAVLVRCEMPSMRVKGMAKKAKVLPAVNAEEGVRELLKKEEGKVLIVPVCQSNMIRSPQVELALRTLIKKNGFEGRIGVISGGLHAESIFGERLQGLSSFAGPSEKDLAGEAEKMDKDFYAKPITRDLAAAADLIIVVNMAYKIELMMKFPELRGLYDKIVTYSELRFRMGKPKEDLADEINIPQVYETVSENFRYLADRAARHAKAPSDIDRNARPLADGSPHSVYYMLKDKFGEWVSPRDIRRLTEGGMDDGHLSEETVGRDLGTLIKLGLVVRGGEGDWAVYKVYPELDPEQMEKVDLILRSLGTRPGSDEIGEAAKKVAEITGKTLQGASLSAKNLNVNGGTQLSTVYSGEIAKPLENVPRGEVRHILVYNLQRYYSDIEPKLGETIIDLWPVVTELWKRFPEATIHVASAYPGIFQAKQFKGRIVSVDPEELRGEKGRIDFICNNKLDMIVEVAPTPHMFMSALKTLYPEPGTAARALGRPYHIGISSPASMTGARSRAMLRELLPISFVDREGKQYEVEGLEGLSKEISEEGFLMIDGRVVFRQQMKKAGSWNYSMGACRMLGLDVTGENLCHIELGLEESVAALKWLESCYYAAGGRSFDPMRKIVVVNVYAVTQGGLVSEEEWIDTIYDVMGTVEDAYFVFTHGGVMDKDFQYVDDIIEGVKKRVEDEKRAHPGNGRIAHNEIILPRVQSIYPHINNLLGVASAVISPDTGFSHLASGVYAVPTAVITYNDIVQWMPPRDTAEEIVLPSVSLEDLMQISSFDPATYRDTRRKYEERKKEALDAGIKTLAANLNKRSEWPSARMAKIAALSTKMRATLDKQLIASPLPISSAVRALIGYVSSAARGMGMANLGLIPRIMVVDSAGQMGIGIPRFRFKLYTRDDGETFLLIDKSAFDAKNIETDVDRVAEIIHEVIGHRLARMLFPEFIEAGVEAMKSGDRMDILTTKATEEVLACLITIETIRRLGPVTASLAREEEMRRFLLVCPGMRALGAEARIRAILDDLLVRDHELNAYWYKEVVRKHGEYIKNRILSAYIPIVERFFAERSTEANGEAESIEEFFDISGKQYGLKSLDISDNYRLLEAYDAAGRKAAYVFAQRRREPLVAPGRQDAGEDGFETKLGISGLNIAGGVYDPNLAFKLFDTFLKKNPNVNVIHKTVWDPMLLSLAQEFFGFSPVSLDEKNTIYIKFFPGTPQKPVMWVPDAERQLVLLSSPLGIGWSGRFDMLAAQPEDLSSFTRIYINTTYVRPETSPDGEAAQSAGGENSAVLDGNWPLDENSMDMVVSRASVNFLASDEDANMYNATLYAMEYGSHGEEDYNKILGLKRKRMISNHIKAWQEAHPGETFSLLDLGAGKAGLIRDLTREAQGIDGKRLVILGVNKPEEKDVWSKFTDPVISQSTSLAGAAIRYFDFFAGWNREKGATIYVPQGEASRNMKAAYFTRQLLRVLRPGGEACIQVGVLSDEEVNIIKHVVETGEKPGIFSYKNGVLHIKLLRPGWGLPEDVRGGEPASVSLVKVRGEWKPFMIDSVQHMLINFIWRELWGRGFELPQDDTIVLDIKNRLGKAWDHYPIHVHSPPGDLIYDRLYTKAASVRMNLPPRNDFRLVTHPGTFRDENGPRSFNLLIPREELVFLRTLRSTNFKAYSRWLDHEAEHLVDRATTKKGLEMKEERITKLSPYDELLAAYNEHQKTAPALAEEELSRLERYIGRLYESDDLLAADAAVKLGRASSSGFMWRDPTLVWDAVNALLYRAFKDEPYSSVEAIRALVLFSEKFEPEVNVESRMGDLIMTKKIRPEQKKALMGFLSPVSLASTEFKENTMHRFLNDLSSPCEDDIAESIIDASGSFDYFRDNMPRAVIKHAITVLSSIIGTGRAPSYFNEKAPLFDVGKRRLAIRALARIFKQIADRASANFIGTREERVTPRELRETYLLILSDLFGLLNPQGIFFVPDFVTRQQAVLAVRSVSRSYFAAAPGTAGLLLGYASGISQAAQDMASLRKELLMNAGLFIAGTEPLEKDYRVRRHLLDLIVEFTYPGFGSFHGILPMIFERDELVPGTSGSLVELVVRAIQRSEDHAGLIILNKLAASEASDLGRQIGRALSEQTGEHAFDDVRPTRLQIPSPRRYIPDIDEKMKDIVDIFCRPDEESGESVLPDERVPWDRVNAILLANGLRTFGKDERPVIHVIDVEEGAEGRGLLGFPLSRDGSNFIDNIPVVSYVSGKDGKLHVFMTAEFYDDYIDISHMNESIAKTRISDMRLAEILDHEAYENSKEAQAYPEEERHHIAAGRARYFIPDRQTISCFHKWVIDSLASTEEGREYLVLLLDEYRPAKDQGRKEYETAFYAYAKSVLPRKKYTREVQRLAHHLLRVYEGGDERAFAGICASNDILDVEELDQAIQAVERKHIINAVRGFKPDITITDTSETTVEIDDKKGIVRKSLKDPYAEFVWDVLMKDEEAKVFFSALFRVGLKDNFMCVYGKNAQSAVDRIYGLMKDHLGAGLALSENKDDAVRDLLKDYLDQVIMLNSYLTAQKRLGGLIADFSIIDGRIYQKKVTPISVYLQHLLAGTGPFAGRAGDTAEKKMMIARNILGKYLGCIKELAKRGAVVSNVKITNFGVTESGEVVLFDLGRSSLSWVEEDNKEALSSLTILQIKLASDAGRIEDLNGHMNAEETGMVSESAGTEEARKTQKEWARMWLGLISEREVPKTGEVKIDFLYDGAKTAGEIEKLLPLTAADAEKEYRKITFMPTEMAEEETLEMIMEMISATRGLLAKGEKKALPDGSPYRIFSILSGDFKGRWVSAEDVRAITGGHAADGHLSTATVMRDLGTLVSLGLVSAKEAKSPKGREIVFRAADLSPPDAAAVKPVLEKLGPRPDREVKSAGREEIMRILEASGTLTREGIRFETSEIGEARKTIEALTGDGKVIGYIYAQADENAIDAEGMRLGIRGIYVDPAYRGKRLAEKLMERMLKTYPDIRVLHASAMNPVLRRMAQENFGFVPENPRERKKAYISPPQKGGEKGQLWIPDRELRSNYLLGPDEAMAKEFDIMSGAPKDLKDFTPVYLDTVYRKGHEEGRTPYWGEKPEQYNPENPYVSESNINRNFTDLNQGYFGDIIPEMIALRRTTGNRPLRILMIGVGRGFEAFELMHEFGSLGIEVTATSKEDLLYRSGEELAKRFMDNGTNVDPKAAEGYIKDLRKRYLKCDLDEGIRLGDNGYDMVIAGGGVLDYAKSKLFALQEMLRVCREGGAVYCIVSGGYVNTPAARVALSEYLASARDARIKDLDGRGGECMKLRKTGGLALPALETVASEKEEGPGAKTPKWRTYYAGKKGVLSPDGEGRSYSGEKDPKEYYKWLSGKILFDKRAGNIRPIGPDDAPAVRELSKRIAALGHNNAVIDKIANGNSEEMADIYVYENKGKVEGYVYCVYREGGVVFSIEEISLSPAAEGKGIASLLLGRALKDAMELGASDFETRVKATSGRSAALFKRFGFEPLETSPPGNTVHYKLSLSFSAEEEDLSFEGAGGTSQEGPAGPESPKAVSLPLTPESIIAFPMGSKELDIPAVVRLAQQDLAYSLAEGGYLPRIGYANIPECLDGAGCKVFGTERMSIACFKVNLHIEDDGRPAQPFAEEYVFSINVDGKTVGHGIVYKLPGYDTVNFRYSIHGDIYGKPNYLRKGYGSEALALIMAMSLKGGIFTGPVKGFAFPHRISDAVSDGAIAGMMRMVKLLEKAGFDGNLRFDMKGVTPPEEKEEKTDPGEPVFELNIPSSYKKDRLENTGMAISNFVTEKAWLLGGKQEAVEDVLHELSLNVKEHGKGGVMRVFVSESANGKPRTLKIVAEDKGKGLDKGLNELIAASVTPEKDRLNGRGMAVICLYPDRVAVEYSGRKFTRETSDRAAGRWFGKPEKSDVRTGTVVTAEFDLPPSRLPATAKVTAEDMFEAEFGDAAKEVKELAFGNPDTPITEYGSRPFSMFDANGYRRITYLHAMRCGRRVAKLFTKTVKDYDPAHLEASRQKFRVEARLTHAAHEAGVTPEMIYIEKNGEPVLVQKEADGEPIGDTDDASVAALARAMARMHAAGIVHEDLIAYAEGSGEQRLKRDHILLTRKDGEVEASIIDFGLATEFTDPLSGPCLEFTRAECASVLLALFNLAGAKTDRLRIKEVFDGAYAKALAGAREEAAQKKELRSREGAAAGFMKEAVIKASSGNKVIIGIETSWIPALQEADVDNLLSALSRVRKKKGLEDIVVLRGKGAALAEKVLGEMKKMGASPENVIVLGAEDVISLPEFDPLRKDQDKGRGAFFAGVALPDDFKDDSYVRILEMVTAAIKLASGLPKESIGDSSLEVIPTGPRSFRFIPKALPVDFEIYKVQAREINTSA